MGDVVLITGASRGVGEACALVLVDAGHHVVAGMRDVGGRNADAAAKMEDSGATVVELDVTSDDSAAAAVAQVHDRFGRIDVLVNNAGYGLFGPMEAVTPSELRDQLDVNVVGPQRLLRAVLPTMRQQRAGLVLQMSSAVGRYVLPGRGAYSLSKWALESMSDTYRIELARFGIDVVTIEIGLFRTGFHDGRVMAGEASDDYAAVVRALADEDATRARRPELYLDPKLLSDAVRELVAGSERPRPWRVVLHAQADALQRLNAHQEEMQRHILEVRGFDEFLPPSSPTGGPHG